MGTTKFLFSSEVLRGTQKTPLIGAFFIPRLIFYPSREARIVSVIPEGRRPFKSIFFKNTPNGLSLIPAVLNSDQLHLGRLSLYLRKNGSIRN